MSELNDDFFEYQRSRLECMLDGRKRYTKPRLVPPHIRKACTILGLSSPRGQSQPELRKITIEVVELAWKKQIADLGNSSDAEAAAYLSTAKELIVKWLREDPDFGGDDPNQSAPVPRKPLPDAGTNSIALSPESETESET
ncbi:MAG: hypothetical protein U0103_02960 [Candidatus Obscuribacterales bacterium]